jgi:hypothetical protein
MFEILIAEMLAGPFDKTLQRLKFEDNPGYNLLYLVISQGTLSFIEKYQMNPADEERLYGRLARLLEVLSDGGTILDAGQYKSLTDKGMLPVVGAFRPDWEDDKPGKVRVIYRKNLDYILNLSELEARNVSAGPEPKPKRPLLHTKLLEAVSKEV